MIYENINSDKWKQITIKKLLSFCDKSPVLLSTQTGIKDGKEGVTITHKNTGAEYFFPFDYTKDPQVFIHEIKEFLIPKHYPLLIEEIYESHELTPLELAEKIEKGAKVDELSRHEMKLTAKKLWRIDKCIVWKDIAILVPLNMDGTEKETTQYRYKYNGSLVVFLRNYRSGVYKSLEEAGKTFFSNSILINEIDKKD